MTDDISTDRCRLVLIAGPRQGAGLTPERVLSAFAGGDIASLILVQGDATDEEFQSWAEAVAPPAQAKGAAVIVAGDSRVAGRIGADGIHLETSKASIDDAVRKHAGRLIIGAGGAKTRHDALELGEAQPDYVFFGRFGYDATPAPHPRNLDLAAWWAGIVNIPCIVQAGAELAGVADCARTGAEFVALSSAVFGDGDPAAAVAAANKLLDEAAAQAEA